MRTATHGSASRCALVTGASRGIGAAAARRLAAAGWAVAINHPGDNSERRTQAEQLASELLVGGHSAKAYEADVADRGAVGEMTKRAASDLGTIGALVINAADLTRVEWPRIDDTTWQHTMAVNLDGALMCAQAVYPGMRKAGYGKIVTVTSVTVALGATGQLPYVTSKAGLIGFTRSLAREVGPDGIRVNAVMPGAIRTEMELARRPDQDALARELADKQSLPVRGTADDVGAAIAFLASPESDFITGQVLCVDGGWVNW